LIDIYNTVNSGNACREEDFAHFTKFVEKMEHSKIIFLSDIQRKSQINISGKKGCKYPYMTLIELTDLCNFSCGHCYKNALKEKPTYLKENDIVDILGHLSDFTPLIGISGGEPCSHPQINQIIKHITERNKGILYTNGTLISGLEIGSLQSLSLVAVSMYGDNSSTYYKATGNHNGFDDFGKGIEILIAAKINLLVTITINKINLHRLKQFIKLLIKLGVRRVSFGIAFPAGRTITEGKENWFLSDTEILHASDMVADISKSYPEIIVQQGIDYDGVSQGKMKWIPEGETEFSCMAGKKMIIITEKGFVKPCVMLPDELYKSITYTEYFDAINELGRNKLSNKPSEIDAYLKSFGFCVENMKCKGYYDFV
jgi:MoaA/NifB/PqqE/SkfB family radical SAM enzyme